MEPLEQSGEKEEHLHPGQLFTQTLAPSEGKWQEGLTSYKVSIVVKKPLW